MSTVLRRPEPPSTNGTTVKARAEAVATAKRPTQPHRRRWGRIGAGAGAALIGAWVCASLFTSAGNRVGVLVMARDVQRYDTISSADLKVVQLPEDSEAAHITEERMSEVIGRAAASDLASGTLLSDAALTAAGDRLLKPDEAIVGVLLNAGDSQMALSKGAAVMLVVRPQTGDNAAPTQVRGWVFDSSAEALNSRERAVSIAVPQGDAAMVSAAGSDKRVTLVVLPG